MFKKRFSGTTELRQRILQELGLKIINIEYEQWLSWKQHGITEKKVMAQINAAL
jgi:hypothetical protein